MAVQWSLGFNEDFGGATCMWKRTEVSVLLAILHYGQMDTQDVLPGRPIPRPVQRRHANVYRLFNLAMADLGRCTMDEPLRSLSSVNLFLSEYGLKGDILFDLGRRRNVEVIEQLDDMQLHRHSYASYVIAKARALLGAGLADVDKAPRQRLPYSVVVGARWSLLAGWCSMPEPGEIVATPPMPPRPLRQIIPVPPPQPTVEDEHDDDATVDGGGGGGDDYGDQEVVGQEEPRPDKTAVWEELERIESDAMDGVLRHNLGAMDEAAREVAFSGLEKRLDKCLAAAMQIPGSFFEYCQAVRTTSRHLFGLRS